MCKSAPNPGTAKMWAHDILDGGRTAGSVAWRLGGPMTAQKETPDGGNQSGADTEQLESGQSVETADGVDNATRRVLSPNDHPNAKRFATVQAKLALQAFVLRKLDSGTFICTRWGLCRELDSLEAVERFAVLVGAA